MSENKPVFCDLGEFVDKAYSNFLLRDVLAIAMPGFIFLFTLLWAWKGTIANVEAALFLFKWRIILLLLISYPVGWSIFFFGVFTRIVKLSTTTRRLEWPWDFTSIDKGLKNAWKKELDFNKRIHELNERNIANMKKEITYNERIVVIRQMVGNLSFSLLLSTIILTSIKFNDLFIKGYPFIVGKLPFIISLLFILIGLVLAHFRLVWQIDLWRDSRLEYKEK